MYCRIYMTYFESRFLKRRDFFIPNYTAHTCPQVYQICCLIFESANDYQIRIFVCSRTYTCFNRLLRYVLQKIKQQMLIWFSVLIGKLLRRTIYPTWNETTWFQCTWCLCMCLFPRILWVLFPIWPARMLPCNCNRKVSARQFTQIKLERLGQLLQREAVKG